MYSVNEIISEINSDRCLYVVDLNIFVQFKIYMSDKIIVLLIFSALNIVSPYNLSSKHIGISYESLLVTHKQIGFKLL